VATKVKSTMAAKFLKRLFEIFCRHEFSWPHSGVHGQDYQVCMRCGAVYEYDWAVMRRTRRLASKLQGEGDSKSKMEDEEPSEGTH
jgi:hypothetical protein